MDRPLDVEYLYYKKTVSDEHGIYRATEKNLQGFLIFTFAEEDDAKEAGRRIAEVLRVPFRPDGPKTKIDKDGWTSTQLHSQVG